MVYYTGDLIKIQNKNWNNNKLSFKQLFGIEPEFEKNYNRNLTGTAKITFYKQLQVDETKRTGSTTGTFEIF